MLFLCLVPVAACRHAAVYDYKSEPDPRKSEFVVGPADILRVDVWRNAELSVEVHVRPDGTITLPLVGDIRASGRTPSQIRAEIFQRLSTFFKTETMQVTVAVTMVNSYRFTVAGNVEHGGVQTSASYMTVLDAIALAGGPNRFASPADTVLIRHGADGSSRRIPIDLERLREGKVQEQNIVVLSGDYIYVP